jgi:rsbT co-antagonist protein RsbR
MQSGEPRALVDVLTQEEPAILAGWLRRQADAARRLGDDPEIPALSRDFLRRLRSALQSATQDGRAADLSAPAWSEVHDWHGDISRQRARQGYSPLETATFVFALKHALFERFRFAFANDPEQLAEQTWNATVLLDGLGLYTTEVHQKGREEVIARQQQEMLELSTPVVELWEGILALPLIGTLDSNRTQVVMESLLERIVETSAEIAIIDITGVPTVDTLVAQHLLKTVAAARGKAIAHRLADVGNAGALIFEGQTESAPGAVLHDFQPHRAAAPVLQRVARQLTGGGHQLGLIDQAEAESHGLLADHAAHGDDVLGGVDAQQIRARRQHPARPESSCGAGRCPFRR